MRNYKVGDRVWLEREKYTVLSAYEMKVVNSPCQKVRMHNQYETITFYSDDDCVKPIITMKATLGESK